MITRKQLIKKYIEFFKSKSHAEIPNSSLVPKDDPTVLFTTAGMHPLVPYLLGQKHPLGKRLVNVQRCIRTGDIEEVENEKFSEDDVKMVSEQASCSEDEAKESLEENEGDIAKSILELKK